MRNTKKSKKYKGKIRSILKKNYTSFTSLSNYVKYNKKLNTLKIIKRLKSQSKLVKNKIWTKSKYVILAYI